MDDRKRAEQIGEALGYIAGMAAGFLIANFIVFPRATGLTLIETVRLLLSISR